MKKKFYPYGKQTLSSSEEKALLSTLKSPFITQGPRITEFEKKFAEYCGAKYAVACNSGTSALHLSCLALDLKKNFNLAVPSVTFLATVNSTQFSHNANVHFIDIDKNSVCLDISHLRKTLSTTKIDLLIIVHFGGQCAEMDEILKLKKKYKFKIIEDSCHAPGSYYKNVKTGSCYYSEATTFSLHPVKHITTGEGGVVTTNNQKIYEKLILFRNHGMHKIPSNMINKKLAFDEHGSVNKWYYEMSNLGFNYRITDLQCSIGITQLKKLNTFIKKRRQIAKWYNKFLDLNLMDIVKEQPNNFHVYHLFTIKIDFKRIKKSRNQIISELLKLGIGSQVLYIPIHFQPYYRKKNRSKLKLKNSEEYYENCLSIPIFPELSINDVKYISKKINYVLS